MFTLSAMSKLTNPRSFIRGIKEYRILPGRGIVVFAILIILCELLLAFSHLSGWYLALMAPLGLVLLCTFFLAVSVNLARGRDLPCLCFGSGEVISPRSLVRLIIALLGELGVLVQSSSLSLADRISSHGSAPDAVLALTWAVLLVLGVTWLLQLPEVIAIARPIFRIPPGVGGRP
jgi:hypothetical protein